MESFETDVELLPDDSGPDFIEDVEGIEWVEEAEPFELPEKKDSADEAASEDRPTHYKKKEQILPDDDSWVLPTDLQLTDLLEPIDEKELDL
jgi:hypothetical protein